MRAGLTPWARAALSDLEKERIKWHLTKGLQLDVGSAASPYRFTVRLFRADWALVAERVDVASGNLFTEIAQMLEQAGEPMMTERAFVGLKDG